MVHDINIWLYDAKIRSELSAVFENKNDYCSKSDLRSSTSPSLMTSTWPSLGHHHIHSMFGHTHTLYPHPSLNLSLRDSFLHLTSISAIVPRFFNNRQQIGQKRNKWTQLQFMMSILTKTQFLVPIKSSTNWQSRKLYSAH